MAMKNRIFATMLAAGLVLGLAACSVAPKGTEESKAEVSQAEALQTESSQEESGDTAPESTASEPEQVSFAGVWTSVDVTTRDGAELTESVLEQAHATLTLYADGTLALESSSVSREGTWSEVENGVQIDADGYSLKAELSGSQLVIDSEEDGVVMTFERTGDAPAKDDAAS